MPFVAFSNNVVGMDGECRFDEVGFDDFKGALGATQHLIQKGHRRIAFCGDIAYPWIHRRFDGYSQGMQDSDLNPVCATAKSPQSFVDFGQDSVPAMLSKKSRPTAIVAGNDEIAYGIWRSLCRHGVKVPNDISLVGFDDRDEAVLMDPPLSTVRVDKEEIGETCMKMLLERLHHPQMAFSQRILPTEFVARSTVRQL
jgi:LacI family transcriptional regulator